LLTLFALAVTLSITSDNKESMSANLVNYFFRTYYIRYVNVALRSPGPAHFCQPPCWAGREVKSCI